MYLWLKRSKEDGVRDPDSLRQILSSDEYKVEFLRYGDKNLPNSNIFFDDAFDFFMNFDKKTFSNPRLEYKRKFFNDFYDNLDKKMGLVNIFQSISQEDTLYISKLLENGLPDSALQENAVFNIILIISIGNSMGWPYENYIDFDIANLDMIADKQTFLHVISHEIHHTIFNSLLGEEYSSQGEFLIHFAFEGLAVHFNNNAKSLYKKPKYPGEDNICIDKGTWDFFDEQFDELFSMFKEDLYKSESMTLEEVDNLVMEKYEQFEFTSLKTEKKMEILHYPTYYIGNHIWGMIDLAFGKETLYKLLKDPSDFIETYNKASIKMSDKKHLL